MKDTDKPSLCLHTWPNINSIKLAGKYINLSDLAKEAELDHSYLSRIFSGHRTPSIPYAKRIAKALGMTFENLLLALEMRKQKLAEKEE